MNEIVGATVSVALALVGLALLATLVSKNANTVGVIGAATKGFAADLSAATNPFSGGSSGVNGLTGGGIMNSGFSF